MVKVKFCGFTREEDLSKALELGVDYVGFVLYPGSPRYVPLEKVAGLLKMCPSVLKVAVMVNPSAEEVWSAFEAGFDLVQLHGEESLEFASLFGLQRIIKAFRSCPGLKVEEEWKKAHAVLVDSCSSSYGGTGLLANWELAKRLVKDGFRVFLAGGLNSKNVKKAIMEVMPYGVDVSSGIEKSPGIKDHRKMEEFVHAVKNASKN